MPALIFNIRHQRINRVDCFLPARYSKNYLYAEFNFLTQDWEGVSKTAVFKSKKYFIPVVLGESDTCLVPHEVLEETKFSVSVFGGNLITVDSEEVKVFEAGYRSDLVEPPTPDVYTQILTSLNGKADDLKYENNILYLMANKNTIASVKIVAGSGGSGADGREVELRNNGEYIQWRYSGEEDWVNLVALADLKGEKGDNYVLTDEDIEEIASRVKVKTSADKITYDDTETQLGATNVQDAIGKLSDQIVDLKENGTTGGTGWTTAQINLLDEIGNYIPFTSDIGGQKWDALIESLKGTSSGGGEEEPDTPEVTLTSISATYNGGEVATGTALSDLTGITVTATYSDGSTKNVTGYTLSGEILEGENTITVSYSGKTTTFKVTGFVESGGDAELPTDGLMDYFDFRTCECNNTGSGGSTLIQPTQGNGQLYTWAHNSVTEQSADYGIKIGRNFMYSSDKSTNQSSCGNAFTWVFKTRYTGVMGNPLFSSDYANNANYNKIAFAPKYNKDGSTAQVSAEPLGTRIETGYDLLALVVNGNICKLYIDGNLTKEINGNTLDGFTSWFDKLTFKDINGGKNSYASQLVIYNKALTEVELTEVRAYLETLEVA